MHDGESQAGVDAPAVDQHRAGPALPVVAALLGARQVEMFAQRVEQRGTWIQVEVPHTAIDGQRELGGVRLDGLHIDGSGYVHRNLTFSLATAGAMSAQSLETHRIDLRGGLTCGPFSR